MKNLVQVNMLNFDDNRPENISITWDRKKQNVYEALYKNGYINVGIINFDNVTVVSPVEIITVENDDKGEDIQIYCIQFVSGDNYVFVTYIEFVRLFGGRV